MSNATVKKERRLQGWHVEIDPPQFYVYGGSYDLEDEAKQAEQYAESLNAFIADHKSGPGGRVFLQREYAYCCSGCGGAWEPCDEEGADDGKLYCACCGALIDQLAVAAKEATA